MLLNKPVTIENQGQNTKSDPIMEGRGVRIVGVCIVDCQQQRASKGANCYVAIEGGFLSGQGPQKPTQKKLSHQPCQLRQLSQVPTFFLPLFLFTPKTNNHTADGHPYLIERMIATSSAKRALNFIIK